MSEVMDESVRKLLRDKLAQTRRELTLFQRALERDEFYGMDYYIGQARSTLGSMGAATHAIYCRSAESRHPPEPAAAPERGARP